VSEKKPVIRHATGTRNNCPVCGKPSYSANGTHPQCAVAQADELTREDRRVANLAMSKEKRKSWVKVCPKCKHEVPSRRLQCDCGHSFATPATAAGSPGY
jgi:hypothetical protein